jgi:hypothetical protein
VLRRGFATAASAALLLGALQATARAADDPSAGAGKCEIVRICVDVHTGGKPGSQGRTPGKPGSSGKTLPASAQQCIVNKLDPQPPAGSDMWQGHDPSEGAIYVRICPTAQAAVGGIVGPEVFWAAQPPAANVDPAQLAQEALDKMTLLGPDIASPRAAGEYLVGLPMWMWVDKSVTTYGPNSASASAGGITVTATAQVSKIVWKMGDGSTVTCNGPGTAYEASYGKQESPSCGHTYTRTSASQPKGKYAVTATSTWTVDWQVNGGGETGQLTAVRQTSTQVPIGEAQIVG